MNSIFRPVALERLASPEELDQFMRVTTPRAWLALAALAALLLAVALWAFLGSIPTRIQGQGVIISVAGLREVYSEGAGLITSLKIRPGQRVEKGQLLAVVAQPFIEDQIRATKSALDQLLSQHKILKEYGEEGLRYFYRTLDQQSKDIARDIELGKKRLDGLNRRIANQEELVSEGLMTRGTLLDTIATRDQVQSEIYQNEGKLRNLEVQRADKQKEQDQALAQSQAKLDEKANEIKAHENERDIKSQVRSVFSGYVYEVRVSEGQVLSAGQVLMTLELDNDDMEGLDLAAAVFFPARGMGKAIQPKMAAQITPTTVKQEEYGSISGEVLWVADYPSSRAGMQRLLKNEELATELGKSGTQLLVAVKMEPDPGTYSGFKWTSSAGPKIKITSGTLIGASVVLREQRPISLVIPLFKKYVLGEGLHQETP